MKLAFVAIALLIVAGVQNDDISGDLKKLQGTWDIVTLVADGKAAPADEVKDSTMVITGHKYVLKGKESYRGTLRLHTEQKPRGIDTVFVDEQGKEVGVAKGIYRFTEDGKLHISWREKGERPTSFESAADSGIRAITLKRMR